MEMETLAYLARSDSSDSDVTPSNRRPTPLDPEYWRGITHSLEETVNPNNAYQRVNRVPHSSSHFDHYQRATSTSYPMSYRPHPVTPHSYVMHGQEVHNDGGYHMSPIHRQAGAPMISVSPVAQVNAVHEGGYMSSSGETMTYGMHRLAERNNRIHQSYCSPTVIPLMNPQELKLQVREAMVRAQAYLDLIPFFQSYDLSFAGGLRIGTIQEALGRMGVILRDHVLQNISQLFNIPGSKLVDYVAFGRFLQLDAHELDNVRSIVAARRSVLENNSIQLRDIFAHYDSYNTGFVSRSTFAALLRDYSILIPDITLHVMMIQLAKSSDTTSISYVRFLEMTDVGVARSGAVQQSHTRTMDILPERTSDWAGGRSNFSGHESSAQSYEVHPAVPLATPATRVVDHASASPDFATPLPRYGWVCRVCTHQQIADWATHCEICETSKPQPGLRGEGYIKCKHCKFDNNYNLDECEMCGRLLNANNKKILNSKKKRRSKKHLILSSSSSSSTLSSSSSSISSGRRQFKKRNLGRHRRSLSRKKNDKKNRFERGEEIQAISREENAYELGVIARVRPNRMYDIEFDNGLYEKNVEENCIRAVSRARIIETRDVSDAEESKKVTPSKGSDHECNPIYAPGDQIEARYNGQGKFYAGTIKKCRIDGTYDIVYHNGEVESQVQSKFIRQRLHDRTSVADTTASTGSTNRYCEPSFRINQAVEAQYLGKSKFYSGVISRCRLNGTYDIDYDDGEKETGVSAELIRPLVKKVGHDADDDLKQKKFKEGDKIEAQYKGKSKFYSGVISRCRLNGTYDIDYDDGEKETGVPAELIRPLGKKVGHDADDDLKQKKFKEGDKVEAQYKGKSKFYSGVISRCRLNGTYDIDYDDGEKETGVPAELIRPFGKRVGHDADDDLKQKKFKEGDKVEAQYKGKSKFYPGVISRCRLNGTYDIDYDDGERETGVSADLIRLLGKKVGHDADDDLKQKKFKEGDKVEAQYKGKSKFYSGVISRCRLNGTYNIDYDDGEKETGVSVELIRPLSDSVVHSCDHDSDLQNSNRMSSCDEAKLDSESLDSVPSRIVYRVGTRVEARSMENEKYFKGTISRVNADETYVIEYDDGDKESRVDHSLIRPLKSLSSFRGDDFALGKPIRSTQNESFTRRSGNLSD